MMMEETHTNTLRKIDDWKTEITLVPFSGIQILDFEFSLPERKIKYEYIEVTEPSNNTAYTKSNSHLDSLNNGFELKNKRLIPLKGDDSEYRSVLYDSFSFENILEYTVDSKKAMHPFLNEWVPVPVLRKRRDKENDGSERFDLGPSTWARMRVVNIDPINEQVLGENYRIQLAIDTSLIEKNDEAYLTPEIEDSRNSREFQFVSDVELMSWFVSRQTNDQNSEATGFDHQKWVMDWLDELMMNFFNQKNEKGKLINRPIDEKADLESCARYLSYIRVVGELVKFPQIQLVDTVSEHDYAPFIEVDLVLDIGNSRTCGILIEEQPGAKRADVEQAYSIALRDLSKPEYYYQGLIESRVEFSEVEFGIDNFSRKTGRSNAFLWPSMLRTGPEASRLTDSDEGTETVSGISSPKRYLWDDKPREQDWRFHNHKNPNFLPQIVGTVQKYVNEAGDCIEQIKEEVIKKLRNTGEISENLSINPRFSRSSLYSFLIAEIISHVLVQINDPIQRLSLKQSNLPRKLRRIIITIPTATPLQEQTIMRSRAESAIKLVWSVMSQAGQIPQNATRPDIEIAWDEASCTQIVYLFNEIVKNFGGDIGNYFKLMGKPSKKRNDDQSEHELRICSIDIGAGTTDMMVTTYNCEGNHMIKPKQNFREGFRIAGDDIMREIISRILIECLIDDIFEKSGHSISRGIIEKRMHKLFGGGGLISQKDRQLQRRFNLRVFIPIAIELMKKSERNPSNSEINLSIGEIFLKNSDEPLNEITEKSEQSSIPSELLDYLELGVQELGVENWKLYNWKISISYEHFEIVIQEVMKTAIENIVEVIDHLACDVVLLSGRPSRLPSLRALVENSCVVPPNRIVSMHNYQTAGWYPYRRDSLVIGDPKTTVVVGGLLMMMLTENLILNISIANESSLMESTAKYIGKLETNGKLTNSNVFFVNSEESPDSKIFEMYGKSCIGSRQLPFERWTTVPLYKLNFTNPKIMKPPIKIKFKLRSFDYDPDPDNPSENKRYETLKEIIEIEDAEDRYGDSVRHQNELSMHIHTLSMGELPLIDDFWQDTGYVARD